MTIEIRDIHRLTHRASIYDYYSATATADVGVCTVHSVTSNVITPGVIHTGDDTAAIQAFFDSCQGGYCDFQPRSDGGTWKISGPIWLQHDTTYDGHGATFEPIDGFASTYGAYTTYNAGTSYTMGDKVSYGSPSKNYIYISSSSGSGHTPTDTTYWNPDMEGFVLQLDMREVPWVTAWDASIDYVIGDKVNWHDTRYTALGISTNKDPRNFPLLWQTDGDYHLIVENSPSSITTETQASYSEHMTIRYTGSKIWVRNFLIDGKRPIRTGYNVDSTLDTSRRVGGIYINLSVTAAAIADDSDISAVDAYVTIENVRIANLTGTGMVVRGRGECKYSKLYFISNSMNGLVVNQYDSNFSDIHCGNSGWRGLVILREKSRDNRFVNCKFWYSGRNISKEYIISSSMLNTYRLNVLGEPTLPWDDTTLLTDLSRTETYTRQDAYIAGITGIAATTAAYTSNSATNSGSGLVTALGRVTVVTNPTANKSIKINGQTVKFVSGTPSGFQVQLGGNTTLTASALATLVNANPQTFYVTAIASTNTVDLTSLLPGAAGNTINLTFPSSQSAAGSITYTNPSGGATITKMAGGVGAPAFYPRDWKSSRTYVTGDRVSVGATRDAQGIYSGGTLYIAIANGSTNLNKNPASQPTFWSADTNNALAHATTASGKAWTAYFGGEDMYVEAADTEFAAVDTQDAFGESIRISGKRLRFVGCCWTQGPDQPRQKYWQKDAIYLKTMAFSDSASWIEMFACSAKDESNPATNYAIGVEGTCSNNYLSVTVPVTGVGGDYHKVSGTLTVFKTKINQTETART